MTEEQPATAPEVVENESQEETQAEIKITDDGKVTKHIIKEGYGPKPRRGQKVTVHYTGTLTDGTKFDSSVDRNKPFMFQVGKGVITGWSIGVMSMKVGEKSMFTMTHEYAYGLHGSPPVIPPMATLKFEIELIRINK